MNRGGRVNIYSWRPRMRLAGGRIAHVPGPLTASHRQDSHRQKPRRRARSICNAFLRNVYSGRQRQTARRRATGGLQGGRRAAAREGWPPQREPAPEDRPRRVAPPRAAAMRSTRLPVPCEAPPDAPLPDKAIHMPAAGPRRTSGEPVREDRVTAGPPPAGRRGAGCFSALGVPAARAIAGPLPDRLRRPAMRRPGARRLARSGCAGAYAGTSGPGALRYCEVIACADQ